MRSIYLLLVFYGKFRDCFIQPVPLQLLYYDNTKQGLGSAAQTFAVKLISENSSSKNQPVTCLEAASEFTRKFIREKTY